LLKRIKKLIDFLRTARQSFYINFISVALQSVFKSWLHFSRSFEITLRHSTRGRIFRTCDQNLRPTCGNKQHSEETDIHALDGTPTQIPEKRKDADLRLRHHDHSDRLLSCILIVSGDSQQKEIIGKT